MDLERSRAFRVEKLKDARLYAILTTSLAQEPLPQVTEKLLAGGVEIFQLREKDRSDRDLLSLAKSLRRIISLPKALFFINDRCDIARLCKADGVHLGQDDLPPSEGRKILGPEALFGQSARTIEAAREAEKEGVDYLGTGAAFPTATKDDARVVGPAKIAEISRAIDIPLFAIGGITAEKIPQLTSHEIHRAVISSHLLQADSPQKAARQCRKLLSK